MQLSQLGDLRKVLNLSEPPLSQQIQKESPGAGTAEAIDRAGHHSPGAHVPVEGDGQQTDIARQVARQGHCQQ